MAPPSVTAAVPAVPVLHAPQRLRSALEGAAPRGREPLDSTAVPVGRVFAAFTHSFYFHIGPLLVCAGPILPWGPRNLVLDPSWSRDLRPLFDAGVWVAEAPAAPGRELVVRSSSGEIIVRLTFASTQYHDFAYPSVVPAEVAIDHLGERLAFLERGTAGFEEERRGSGDLWASELAGREGDLTAVLARSIRGQSASVEVHTATLRLLGFGPGLTPAGDDFLAGLMVGLRCFGGAALALLLAQTIAGNRSRTNEISAAFLADAADLLVTEPVRHFLDLLQAVPPALPDRRGLRDLHHLYDLREAGREVTRWGATSGRHVLLGIIAGARVGLDCTKVLADNL